MALNLGCKQRKKRSKAMTLIELLAVIAIIAALVVFTYPTYLSHVIVAKRHVALSDISRIQLYLENGYNGSYVSARNAVMSGGSCQICESAASDYSISVTANINSYTITANPNGNQEQDDCLINLNDVITLNQTNQSLPSSCWK